MNFEKSPPPYLPTTFAYPKNNAEQLVHTILAAKHSLKVCTSHINVI
ncbi:hypothetical protein HMPREF0868_1249 [Mageeibacillus indolicus UPII9-5]|uniref:Uncharacterized protein n=1 Tax=Mageeibacillus indolicus (strain UPII9-5) TaxID=699246 RepID=D3R2W8_MAGIU|nr:hypothetical protein HMPREF0868_1249 [Mageeibacillus indolicus UPII9-5]